MAGYVRAHIEVSGSGFWEVLPIACPGADEHTAGEVRCQVQHADGWVRTCLYLVSTCANDNCTERIHGSVLAERALIDMHRQSRCGVLCQRQRGNRPPGC